MIVQWHGEKHSPLGRCLYCPATSGLTDEHIIPFGMLPKGGDWFLPKASCIPCADITKRFEDDVLRGMFGPFRQQLDLKTRRKKTGRMQVQRGHGRGIMWGEEVDVASFPKMCIGFRWPIPGIILGKPSTNQFAGEFIVKCDPAEMDKYAGQDGDAFRIARVAPLTFARMLAKIAHCYAVAKYGFESFDPLLIPLIRGETDAAPYLIGGDGSESPPNQPNVLHDVFRMDCHRDDGPTYLGVAIRLFAMVRTPRYHVVVDRRLKEAPPIEKRGDTR